MVKKKKSNELIRSWTHAVRAAPLALWGLVQLRLEADEVISSGAGVTQDDLPTLLTHLAVVLMVRLIAIALLFTWDFMETSSMFFLLSQLTCKSHFTLQRIKLGIITMWCKPFFFFLAGRPRLFFLTRPELSERTEELWTLESSCSDSSSSISSLWWRKEKRKTVTKKIKQKQTSGVMI